MLNVSNLLALAENFDSTQSNFVLILSGGGAAAAVFVLAGAIIIIARKTAHRHAEALMTASVFWGLISLASIIYTINQQMQWSKEYTMELMSGYGNPTATPPPLPWVLWGAMAAVYFGLLGWAALKRRKFEMGK